MARSRNWWSLRHGGVSYARNFALVLTTAALMCGLGAPRSARAEARKSADHEYWTPSIALQMNVLRQKTNGGVVSNVRPPSLEGTPISGGNLLLDYAFGASIDVMAPALFDAGGRPQPFIHLDVMHPLGLEIDVAREGSPDGFNVPDFGFADARIPAVAVGGQGQKTEAEFKSPAIAAGIGVSFSFQLLGQDIRVRPSVQYFQQDIQVTGTLLVVEGERVIAGGVQTQDFLETILIRKSNRLLHAVGGGVEVELDIAEVPGGELSLGMGIHVYRLQSDRRFDFSATNGRNLASFGAALDPLIYRGGFSLRYRFNPQDLFLP